MRVTSSFSKHSRAERGEVRKVRKKSDMHENFAIEKLEEFVAHDYAINRRESRPNNMNLNLNSLHAFLKCFDVANELVFFLPACPKTKKKKKNNSIRRRFRILFYFGAT